MHFLKNKHLQHSQTWRQWKQPTHLVSLVSIQSEITVLIGRFIQIQKVKMKLAVGSRREILGSHRSFHCYHTSWACSMNQPLQDKPISKQWFACPWFTALPIKNTSQHFTKYSFMGVSLYHIWWCLKDTLLQK